MSNLKFNNKLLNNINNFEEYITLILSSLEITKNMVDTIKESFSQFNDSTKYEIVSNLIIKEKLNNLIKFDKQLAELNKLISNDNKISFEETKKLFGELQGLILLRSINISILTNNKQKIIDDVINSLNSKLKIINTLLKENITNTTQNIEPMEEEINISNDVISKKITPKKITPKKITPKKIKPIKEEPIKEEPIKEEPIKEEPIKEESKKISSKKDKIKEINKQNKLKIKKTGCQILAEYNAQIKNEIDKIYELKDFSTVGENKAAKELLIKLRELRGKVELKYKDCSRNEDKYKASDIIKYIEDINNKSKSFLVANKNTQNVLHKTDFKGLSYSPSTLNKYLVYHNKYMKYKIKYLKLKNLYKI